MGAITEMDKASSCTLVACIAIVLCIGGAIGYTAGNRSPVCEVYSRIWRIELHGARRILEINSGQYVTTYDQKARPGMFVCLDGLSKFNSDETEGSDNQTRERRTKPKRQRLRKARLTPSGVDVFAAIPLSTASHSPRT